MAQEFKPGEIVPQSGIYTDARNNPNGLRTQRPNGTRNQQFTSRPSCGREYRILPSLPSVTGKPVHVAFDGGRMMSYAGILLLAATEQRLGVADLAFKMAVGRWPTRR